MLFVSLFLLQDVLSFSSELLALILFVLLLEKCDLDKSLNLELFNLFSVGLHSFKKVSL